MGKVFLWPVVLDIEYKFMGFQVTVLSTDTIEPNRLESPKLYTSNKAINKT